MSDPDESLNQIQNRNPLRFNLYGQIAQLVAQHPNFDFPEIFSRCSTTSSGELLNSLARLLAVPALTGKIALGFKPLLLDLCARWLLMEELEDRLVFEAFAALLEPHGEVFPYVATSFYLSHIPFNLLNL